MLYIECTINKKTVQAFVDSGAQSTIMSLGLARELGLERLIDKRFKGQAVGVGVGNIVGRVHCAEMTIEGNIYPLSLTILEGDKVDFLFGLDMLKRHRISIDLY
jgi:DNA damage-inducible protein 1